MSLMRVLCPTCGTDITELIKETEKEGACVRCGEIFKVKRRGKRISKVSFPKVDNGNCCKHFSRNGNERRKKKKGNGSKNNDNNFLVRRKERYLNHSLRYA